MIELPFVYNMKDALVRLQNDPVHTVDIENEVVWIPMEEGNLIRLQSKGRKERPSFEIDGAADEAQTNRVKEIFHFHQSLDEVTNHFGQTDLAPLFNAYKGMPLVRSFSLYGNLMKEIIHQQLNLSFSNTLTLRFVQKYGHQIEGIWTYPDPETIADLSISELSELQFSERKAEYMISLSQAIATGALDLHALEKMGDNEVMHVLTAYRGVGPWTAQNFLLFGLGRPNLFPITDVGLQNALKTIWGMDKKPTKEEMSVCLPNWSPYLSYVALYLWKSTEVK